MTRRPRLPRLVSLNPPAVLALLYLCFIVLGALLLLLPGATVRPITLWEALFTSTSAVTVTGLAVIDTGSGLTVLGQAVLAGLIQFGGLGLMAFAALVLSALGIPMGLHGHAVLREDLNQTSLVNLGHLVQLIFKIAVAAELAGTALLACVFVPEMGWGRGLWASVFHAISAFNNAGFSLWPDSLSAWVGHPIVAFALPMMWVLGGLGFVVLADIAAKRSFRRLSLHSKLMLVGSAILSAWSIGSFAVLEWTNPATLGPLTEWQKFAASVFQGLTPRTAGFNTVDISGIHDSTALLMISQMLIGGGSTSTAGGIKVTTAIVLLLATVAFFRRSESLSVFGRSLALSEVMKVLALTTLSTLVVMSGIFLVSLSHDGSFLALCFEIASAFGTVGLSMGATGDLDGFGRMVIMVIMFLGRVGPLTLGFFLATRTKPRVTYPSGQVYLG